MSTYNLSRYVGSAVADPDFRHYNYCAVPYFGASDDYLYVQLSNEGYSSLAFQIYEEQKSWGSQIYVTFIMP